MGRMWHCLLSLCCLGLLKERFADLCEAWTVVRTGARAQALRLLLNGLGYQSSEVNTPAPRLADLDRDWGAALEALYRSLGGIEPMPLLRPDAPRWKQRALYDAVKDLAALSGSVRLARLSVWDTVGATSLGDALADGVPIELPCLEHLVEQRTSCF